MSKRSHLSKFTASACNAVLRALCAPTSHLFSATSTSNHSVLAHANFDWDYWNDHDRQAVDFAKAYQVYSLARKLDCLETGIDTRATAYSTWFSIEQTCRIMNQCGRMFTPLSPLSGPFEQLIQSAKVEMRKLLGPLDLNSQFDSMGFSGGASTRLKRANGHPFYKLQGKPEVTREAALPAICAIWASEAWRRDCQDRYGRNSDPTTWVTIVPGGRLTTVPKDAKTDRTIIVEPDMNMFLQRGAGATIRRRLRAVGINLNDQTRNQQLALIGSRTGSLATIDLSSASDAISNRIVRELLPPAWYDWLNRIRSTTVVLDDGSTHNLEKFSSMGNGFTFELESAIFYCLCKAVIDYAACPDTRLGVYGDDIVLHHSCVELLTDLFSYVGFTINREKSFSSGPFRESCGKHYFRGCDVTPFYIKQDLSDLHSMYWLANSLLERSDTHPAYTRVRRWIIRQLPPRLRNYVPRNFGLRAGLHGDFDEARPAYSKRKQAFVFKVYRPTRRKHRINGAPAVLYALATVSEESLEYIDVGKERWRFYKSHQSSWC